MALRRPPAALVTGGSLVCLLFVWTALDRAGVLNPVLVPPPATLAETARSMVLDGYPESTPLIQHVVASLGRIGVGYGLAAAAGVPLGIALGSLPALFDLLSPLVAFFRAVPTVSLIPLAIIALGIGEASKVALVGFGCFWVILTNVIDGVRMVDPALIRSARALGANTRQMLTWVVLPAAFPRIVTGLRLGLGIAFMVLVAAEMFASESGLGFLIVDGRRFFRADVVLVGMVLIGLIGAALMVGFDLLERRFLRWAPSAVDWRK